MNDAQVKAAVDKLLDDRAMLLYGVKYDALKALQQDQVIAEAVQNFDSGLVDAADAMERP